MKLPTHCYLFSRLFWIPIVRRRVVCGNRVPMNLAESLWRIAGKHAAIMHSNYQISRISLDPTVEIVGYENTRWMLRFVPTYMVRRPAFA